ncbi:homocysteine S-methyltransferase family protein [Candidatus Persebacteraceae bacterium Df01]|jgi:betaine-homocysteine S-methyltransferase|uniref:Homocysteine S-methyltransferase family protein n=1 Tax=Candidatus Doriopsillibacter californiensis TaxID=2970740 RepID=A0ABT7QKG1_9GAMM|nr:homocysteine S-methyltransferase family protein [Candidatus Persebacteraceae bacterium Df01]
MGKLTERLDAEAFICAEGYLFELERRGYLQAGSFVPEVVLENPEVLAQLHREFLRAGSDAMVAFTYYGHREKLRIIGKEDLLEPLQKNALLLAKQAAAEDKSGRTLVAGNICNTNVYFPDDKQSHNEVRKMFAEQVAWAADAGVDFILVETLSWLGEGLIALEEAKKAGVDVVVNVITHSTGLLREGIPPEEACKQLEDAGADVVGMNCCRGPATMLPQLKDIRAAVSGHVAGIPVTFRTSAEMPSFQSIKDPCGEHHLPEGMRAFPAALDAFTCTRYEMAAFARECFDNNIRMVGVCCGGGPHHVRAIAEELGRQTEASRYSPDMSKHYAMGTDPSLKSENQKFLDNL